jgi:formylglycine-generating enzyme required for sulfatase activity/predicted Ser/Thr protein kinase
MLNIGEKLVGRYRIEEKLGEGGMGAVYRAQDWLKDRLVAIKEFRLGNLPSEADLVPPGGDQTLAHPQATHYLTREKAMEQFATEARLLSALHHSNLPEVYDFFTMGFEGYIVMTLIEGHSLADWVERFNHPIPEQVARNWLEQILDALIYCHSNDVIHRDLKPENILLTDNGQIYLIDFGIAKLIAGVPKATSIGARSFTPGFAPPEQYSGRGGTDGRTDLYSLGAVAYYLMTRQAPTDAADRMAGDEPIPPRNLNPQVSVELENFILHCLELRKPDRPASATKALELLTDHPYTPRETPHPLPEDSAPRKPGRPTIAPPTPPQPPVGPGKSRAFVFILIGTALFLLVLAVLGYMAISRLFPGPVVVEQETATATLPPTDLPPSPTLSPPTEAPVLPSATPTDTATPIPTVDPLLPPACTRTGQKWTSPADSMTLVCVPAGSFTMGTTQGEDDEEPAHRVTLDAFWIDSTEVTNAQFADFLNLLPDYTVVDFTVTVEKRPFYMLDNPTLGWTDRITYTKSNFKAIDQYLYHPVVMVTWLGAEAYCKSVGRRLPTEAEWEKAARGETGDLYPWGNSWLNSNANSGQYDAYKQTAPIGSFPEGISPYGAFDMIGNVWEWTADWYDPEYYSYSPGDNPTGAQTGIERVMRGGAWVNLSKDMKATTRGIYGPWGSWLHIGFRCVR